MAQAIAILGSDAPIATRLKSRQATTLFLAAGALAPLLFMPMVLIAGRVTPEYGHISSTFSDAASQGSPRPEFVTTGLMIVASCLFLAAFGLARTLPSRRSLVRICLCASAMGILGTALFRDYNRSPGVPRNQEGQLHNSFAILTILAIELTILLIWFVTRNQQGWRHLATPAMISFLVVAVAGMGFNFGPDSHDGLAERILAGTAFLFLSSLCLTALTVGRGEPFRWPRATSASAPAQPFTATVVLDE